MRLRALFTKAVTYRAVRVRSKWMPQRKKWFMWKTITDEMKLVDWPDTPRELAKYYGVASLERAIELICQFHQFVEPEIAEVKIVDVERELRRNGFGRALRKLERA